MAGERSADDIQADIEKSRAALAEAVDQLAERTSPRRIADEVKQTLREKANSVQGRIVIGVSGGFVVLLVVRRFRKRRAYAIR